jgi:hypothetical protein
VNDFFLPPVPWFWGECEYCRTKCDLRKHTCEPNRTPMPLAIDVIRDRPLSPNQYRENWETVHKPLPRGTYPELLRLDNAPEKFRRLKKERVPQ